ncbi:hypothetical protein J2X20_002158 [Pelomonas saccharophila]|uniref:Uncharacterized protein n=1 Tax=Roseateles saccharophilus TaxID=304 RepID=A0ABU1YKZ0_ROSSA|nr:hypothetical protein [Roseateles saccharophilus]MDR7269529.1 hypothetical protein [Roseateles saccharophilus]
MRPLLYALALATVACTAQAETLQSCDEAVVLYSAPQLIPLQGHVTVKRLAARPAEPPEDEEEGAEDKRWAPQRTAAFTRVTRPGLNGPDTVALQIFSVKTRARWRMDFDRELDSVEARWINEELIFMRAWWGRIVSTDLIMDIGSGRFLYAKEANYGLLTQPCAKPQPK